MVGLRAEHFPAAAVRTRARTGCAAVFPPEDGYGTAVFGAAVRSGADLIDSARLVPPVFTPHRLERLIDLAREPTHRDVVLDTVVGGFRSPLPVYLSAFGSTRVATGDLGLAASRQAGRLGIPMCVGENIVPVNGYRRAEEGSSASLLGRIRAYAAELGDGGGVVVQQSTEDADAEVWNLVYSDPGVRPLLDSGRLAFELKVGQGAKPGLGGMTVLDRAAAARVADQYTLDPAFGAEGVRVLRCASPGTFTAEILRHQVRLMGNNFPRARRWVKLPPARDVLQACTVAWEAGADAVTVDGAEAGTGWAPLGFLDHVGLSLGECLSRIGRQSSCLLASGRMWEGTRVAKCLAMGATAVGLGRAALLAVDEDGDDGLVRLVDCLALELRMIISALGKYTVDALDLEDIWF
ncbi:glutamate synthase-related protein [Actinophytocola sp.]|uniref:glutamate synthase-related protein n=1 Tax=Actinophytocola sp. TaxID=1872138 RepID=UPI00389A3EDC